jgi:peptidoglycan L-alanyl-D-glutamate endopeptidase CwlK
MINSRNIEDLHPSVQKMAVKFLKECAEAGINVLITSTYRDAESQNALYAIGRTKPGKKLTNAKAGQSFHNYRCALDFVPLVYGKPAWTNTALFTQCGGIAEAIGFEWAGRWKTFKELAHIQYTGGLSLKDLQSGKTFK